MGLRYFFVALVLLAAPAHAGTRVALIIGNSFYSAGLQLPNPANDAADLSVAFARIGFDVTTAFNLEVSPFRRALHEFEVKARGAELAVIYYAGHGMEMNGTNYLIPTDATLLEDNSAEDEAISLQQVMAAVAGASGLKLILLDACRDNPFTPQGADAKRAAPRGLAPVEPEGKILVAYAAKAGAVAEDGVGRNSPFASALLANLEEPGLEIKLFFLRVRDDVLSATGRRQSPFVYGAPGREAIYLNPVEGAAAPKDAMQP